MRLLVVIALIVLSAAAPASAPAQAPGTRIRRVADQPHRLHPLQSLLALDVEKGMELIRDSVRRREAGDGATAE